MRSIAYRETIRTSAIGERKYIRRLEGRGHFAHLRVGLIPAAGKACSISRGTSLSIPEDCYESARLEIAESLSRGPLQRLPMWGLEVEVIGGTFYDRFSHPRAFAAAARMALDDGLRRACPVLAEPWLGARLRVDEGAVSRVLAGLTDILGILDAKIMRGPHFVVEAQLPERLSEVVRMKFALSSLETFQLPPALQYRPMTLPIPGDAEPSPGWDEWT